MKRKKSLLILLLTAVFAIVCLVGLCSCDLHEHKFETMFTSDATHHWYQCRYPNCKKKSGYETHDFSNGNCECTRFQYPITDNVLYRSDVE